MKHQRVPTLIEDSSDNEGISRGPLRKRQKRSSAPTAQMEDKSPALTLESLIRAGEALRKEEDTEQDGSLGRVTPTKEVLAKEEQVDRKLVQTALSDTLAGLGAVKPVRIPHSLPEISSPSSKNTKTTKTSSKSDWRKYCRPLAAPPRLPNVPCGFKCV